MQERLSNKLQSVQRVSGELLHFYLSGINLRENCNIISRAPCQNKTVRSRTVKTRTPYGPHKSNPSSGKSTDILGREV
jgi:hypothetical protein